MVSFTVQLITGGHRSVVTGGLLVWNKWIKHKKALLMTISVYYKMERNANPKIVHYNI